VTIHDLWRHAQWSRLARSASAIPCRNLALSTTDEMRSTSSVTDYAVTNPATGEFVNKKLIRRVR